MFWNFNVILNKNKILKNFIAAQPAPLFFKYLLDEVMNN